MPSKDLGTSALTKFLNEWAIMIAYATFQTFGMLPVIPVETPGKI